MTQLGASFKIRGSLSLETKVPLYDLGIPRSSAGRLKIPIIYEEYQEKNHFIYGHMG